MISGASSDRSQGPSIAEGAQLSVNGSAIMLPDKTMMGVEYDDTGLPNEKWIVTWSDPTAPPGPDTKVVVKVFRTEAEAKAELGALAQAYIDKAPK